MTQAGWDSVRQAQAQIDRERDIISQDNAIQAGGRGGTGASGVVIVIPAS